MTRVLVVQPDESDPAERLGEQLAEAGFELVVVRPYLGEPVPVDPAAVGAHALVVLGGDMGANDVAEHPWLADVMALLRSAVEAASPTLGICLGGQLLAAATGGEVERGAAGTEAGTVLVRPRPEAADDPLLGRPSGLPEAFRMITMHRDAVTRLPDGAVWLADSEVYGHQAFRVGTAAWGLQFHPEVSPATYAAWAAVTDPAEPGHAEVQAGVAETERHDPEVRAAAHALVAAFARVVRGGGRTMRQRMEAGEPYVADDLELQEASLAARELAARYNAAPVRDADGRRALLEQLLGSVGEGTEVRAPLHVDYGTNVTIGARCFANYGLVALDVAAITIGDDVQIGPNVQLLTPTHPLEPGPRREKWEAAQPITIGDNVWLGGGVVVLPGVTIGADTVVGAGAVVVRDLPAGVVAVGNPARVVRRLDGSAP